MAGTELKEMDHFETSLHLEPDEDRVRTFTLRTQYTKDQLISMMPDQLTCEAISFHSIVGKIDKKFLKSTENDTKDNVKHGKCWKKNQKKKQRKMVAKIGKENCASGSLGCQSHSPDNWRDGLPNRKNDY